MKIILISLFALLADQITKVLVSNFMEQGQSIRIFGDYIRFTYILNPHGVFGISFGPFFPYLVGLACLILLILTIKTRSGLLSLILGGALGNFIDRIRIGAVVDFIDIGVGRLRWPIFNVADSCITVGMIILIVVSFRKTKL
ncbi:signal peptidase II [candidate division WOR-3 bacterium]|nr:signal peptidase II [candidate division WOR-3 bacterium]